MPNYIPVATVVYMSVRNLGDNKIEVAPFRSFADAMYDQALQDIRWSEDDCTQIHTYVDSDTYKQALVNSSLQHIQRHMIQKDVAEVTRYLDYQDTGWFVLDKPDSHILYSYMSNVIGLTVEDSLVTNAYLRSP